MFQKTLLLPLAAAGLLAAGCGSSDSSSSTTTAAQAPTTTAAKAPPTTTAANAPTARAASVSSGPISVRLTEWKILPSTTTAKAGKVRFDVTNDGKVVHEFVVLRTAKPAGDLGTGSRIKESGHVGETGDIKVG